MHTLMILALTLLISLTPAVAADESPEAKARRERFQKLHADSEPFLAAGDAIMAELGKGDGAAVRARMSPTTVARQGAAKIDEVFATKIMPYFAKYGSIDPDSTAVAPTDDGKGLKGFSIQYVFVDQDGERRPLVMYLVRENDKIVVANLVPGRTLEEAGRARPTPATPAP